MSFFPIEPAASAQSATNPGVRRPRILISNDDGIDAPGIRALHDELALVADTLVVAPVSERSAVGHGISVHNQITMETRERNGVPYGYAIDGTPADCVKMGLFSIWKDSLPDLVISGINRGQNTGTSILYSGTVAAALEGALAGIPSIAVSLAFLELYDATEEATFVRLQTMARNPDDYRPAARFAARLALHVARRGLPRGILLNVNYPFVPESEVAGVAVSKMGHSIFIDEFRLLGEEAGISAYRNVGNQMIPSPTGEDWDDHVLARHQISVTPLHYDLTGHHYMDELRDWLGAPPVR